MDMTDMKTLNTLVGSFLTLAMCLTGLAQNVRKVEMLRMEIPRIVVTNLSDRLQTEVTIDNTTGIDIRRLNQDSIHTDEHQSHYTTIKNITVNPPTIRKVVMVKPILSKDDLGNF